MEDRVKVRIQEMIDHAKETVIHTRGWGDVGPRVREEEMFSLLNVLHLAMGADELWLDGRDGLGGRNGYVFGLIPHRQYPTTDEDTQKLFEVMDASGFVPRSWSAHS